MVRRLCIPPVERGINVRPDEALASLHKPPEARKRQHTSDEHDGPVHRRCIRMRYRWPQQEERRE